MSNPRFYNPFEESITANINGALVNFKDINSLANKNISIFENGTSFKKNGVASISRIFFNGLNSYLKDYMIGNISTNRLEEDIFEDDEDSIDVALDQALKNRVDDSEINAVVDELISAENSRNYEIKEETPIDTVEEYANDDSQTDEYNDLINTFISEVNSIDDFGKNTIK